ncbi:hypothetical protein Egran_02645 [Elaphomyces granulatus]|uniref:Uncharacterized protein n=1 Tax=Elaphomyces granulatus TaxID=519963 RepID=A0A232LZP6_9EURO|nr:hypothetical protein Egran_02645 [Elaphomyces granulatus]
MESVHSALMAFFDYNARNVDGRQFRYPEFPEHYVYEKKDGKWKPRLSEAVFPRAEVANASRDPDFFAHRAILTIRNDQLPPVNTCSCAICPGSSGPTIPWIAPSTTPVNPHRRQPASSCRPLTCQDSHRPRYIGAPVMLMRNMNPRVGLATAREKADVASPPTGAQPPEDVGKHCVYQLLETISKGGCASSAAAPTMLTLMAICMGSEDVGRLQLGREVVADENLIQLARDLTKFGAAGWGIRYAAGDNPDGDVVIVSVVGRGIGNVGRKVA